MPKRVDQERIVYALKQAEAGVKPNEICRENGISEQAFYNWKRKYGGMRPPGISKVRAASSKTYLGDRRGIEMIFWWP
jgi:putative transposase